MKPGDDRKTLAHAALLKRLAAPAALAATSLAVWLTYPDKTFVFDGVMFAQYVDRSVNEWRGELLNPRHLLFNPFFQLLRDALLHAGVTIDAYRLFQTVNALAGAAGLLLFGDLARRLSRDAALGWCAALLLGGTWCYGTRATEGQVYMFMSLGVLAFLWAAVRLLERPTAARAALAVGAAALAALFHAADAFLFPAAAAALWLAFPKRRRWALAGAAAAALSLIVPYLFVFGGVGLREFVGSATDFRAGSGAGFWSGLFSTFWRTTGTTSWARLTEVWRETGSSLIVMPGGGALAAGLALWAGTGAALKLAWGRLDAPRRAEAVVLAAVWGGFTVVNAFWPGGWFFYVPGHACALALLALAAGPFYRDFAAEKRRGALGGLVFIGLAAAVWNVRAGIMPQSRLENNAGYRQAMFVGAHTEPSAWVIISGLGFSNSKVYLPQFAHRTREVLEYYFDRDTKDAALRKLAAFSEGVAANGIPMYLLSDLVENPGVFPVLQERFGVSRAEIQNAFGAGGVVLVAKGPEERVYLFVPAAHQPELFVVLGYSLLSERDDTRLAESIATINEIARSMSPAERRRAAELMRATNWGFDMLIKGFGPMMNPESLAAAKAREQTFNAYKNTPDFWLRTGNLYKILGLKSETIEAWTRAQTMSGNAPLLKQIREFRASK